MSTEKRKREIFPSWDMPSDPVKAVIWFMHWLLKVTVRFCWIPIILMTVCETYLNWMAGGGLGGSLISGVITLFVGVGIWAVLYIILLLLNVSATITRVISDVSRAEQRMNGSRPFYPVGDIDESRIVEGTITDLEEERRKRRRE